MLFRFGDPWIPLLALRDLLVHRALQILAAPNSCHIGPGHGPEQRLQGQS